MNNLNIFNVIKKATNYLVISAISGTIAFNIYEIYFNENNKKFFTESSQNLYSHETPLTLNKENYPALTQSVYEIKIFEEMNQRRVSSIRSTNLVSNTKNRYRHVAILTREEGIKQIMKLLYDEEFEEAWAFIPQMQKWIEVGYGERILSSNGIYINYTLLDVNHIRKLLSDYNYVELFHYHPRRNEINYNGNEQKSSDIYNEDSFPSIFKIPRRKTIEDRIKEKISSSALPSLEDLVCMINLTSLSLNYYPNSQLRFFVCSEYGIAEYGLTEKGKQALHTKEIVGLIKYLLDYMSLQNKSVIKSSSGYILSAEIIQKEISSDYVKIDFISN